jgi:hypothetical protein
MAAIPAANITNRSFTTWGNKRAEIMTVKGDGSGTTLQARLGKIEGAFVGNQTETAGYNPQLSWSGAVLTYGAAPTSNLLHTLVVVGID